MCIKRCAVGAMMICALFLSSPLLATAKPNCACNVTRQDCPGDNEVCKADDCTQVPKGCADDGNGNATTCNGKCVKVKKKTTNSLPNILGGAGFDGFDISVLEPPNSLFGYIVSATTLQADDFMVAAGDVWDLTEGIVFMYQLDGLPGETISELFIRVWDQPPTEGATPFAGDLVTNRLISSRFAGLFRVPVHDLMDVSRAVSAVSFDMSWLGPIGEGEYWIEFSANGLGGGEGPAILVGTTEDPLAANSRAFDIATGTWQDNIDPGSGLPGDLPFLLYEIDTTGSD